MPLFVVWVLLGVVQLWVDKYTVFLFCNRFHAEFLNDFFVGATHFGEGSVAIAVVLVLLGYDYKKGLLAAFILVSGLGLVSVLKFQVFGNIGRPLMYFGNLNLEIFKTNLIVNKAKIEVECPEGKL